MNILPKGLRAWAEIDLAALERNLGAIRQALPRHLKTIAVVKANAYGHGLAPVVSRLMRSGADAFAVANLEEAARIRELGTGWPILTLSVLLPEEYEQAMNLDVSPLISSAEEARQLDAIARKHNRTFAVHLKIDTGMGRLGVWYPHFAALLGVVKSCKGLALQGICTHFAAAESNAALTQTQRQRFTDCVQLIESPQREEILLHADNSAGIHSYCPGGPFNAIRVGLLQFGVPSDLEGPLQPIRTEPVLSFHARVGLVKTLPVGSTISYGQTVTLKRPSHVAVLTAGYADGLTTALSNRGSVLIHNQRCRLLGRITMDQCMADVTDLTTTVRPGDTATFIGGTEINRISVGQFAAWSGQIPWEALCALSNRTRRIYLNDSAI